MVRFSGGTNQAGQFACGVPDFVLKSRFADVVRLDLAALEQEMGFAVGRNRGWWQRIMRRSIGQELTSGGRRSAEEAVLG